MDLSSYLPLWPNSFVFEIFVTIFVYSKNDLKKETIYYKPNFVNYLFSWL